MVTYLANNKILSVEELSEVVAQLKRESKQVVLCHGVFDLLHPGHIRHFEAAKRFGDVLVVTLTRDEHVNKGPGRPVFNQRLRAESIAALQTVDFVAVNGSPTAVEAIQKIRPDFYVKGKEYADAALDLTGMIDQESAAIAEVGGQIRFTDDITFSSTRLLNSHFSVYPEPAEIYLREFRRKYDADDIIAQIRRLRDLKVLLVGDTIIDEYFYCAPLGKSPKDTFLVTKFQDAEVFAGGVLAAANHVAGFCDRVDLVTCLGTEDSREEFIRSRLKPNVRPKLFRQEGARTTIKRRFVEPAFFRKMFEVCYLDDAILPKSLEERVGDHLASHLREYDLVILTDFGHGFVSRGLSDVLCDQAPFLAINAQTNSANAGFNLITKYPRADYICIDEPELRLAAADRHGDLPTLITAIAGQLNSGKVSITRGARGAMTYSTAEGFFEIPVFSNKVLDTMGAGDAYLSVTAPCVAMGVSMELVGFIGNAVGALAVQILGNRAAVEPIPLFKSVTAMLQ